MKVPKTHLTAIMAWCDTFERSQSQNDMRLLALKSVTVNGAVLATLIAGAASNPARSKIIHDAIAEAIRSGEKALLCG